MEGVEDWYVPDGRVPAATISSHDPFLENNVPDTVEELLKSSMIHFRELTIRPFNPRPSMRPCTYIRVVDLGPM